MTMVLQDKKLILSASFIISVTIGFCAENPKTDQNWGQWRGPLATGYAPHANPPIQWSENKNDRSGKTLVIEHSKNPTALSFKVLNDSFSASPALSGSNLILRGEKFLYCLGSIEGED